MAGFFMTAQPLPKTNELIGEINSYMAKNRRPTDWQIKLLNKKANDLRGKIPENIYYDVLGRIASLEQNCESLFQFYQIALKLAPTDFQTQYHYLIALSNAGIFSKALIHGRTVLAEFPEHSEAILSWLVKCAFMACRMHDAFSFLMLLNNPDQNEYCQRIKKSIAIFEAAELNDDVTEHLQNLVFSVMQKNNLYFSTAEIIINRDCFHYQIYVDLPIEDIFELNWQLADVLVENTENTYSDTILFEYESMDVFDEHLAS
jgi:hypothetical protein